MWRDVGSWVTPVRPLSLPSVSLCPTVPAPPARGTLLQHYLLTTSQVPTKRSAGCFAQVDKTEVKKQKRIVQRVKLHGCGEGMTGSCELNNPRIHIQPNEMPCSWDITDLS